MDTDSPPRAVAPNTTILISLHYPYDLLVCELARMRPFMRIDVDANELFSAMIDEAMTTLTNNPPTRTPTCRHILTEAGAPTLGIDRLISVVFTAIVDMVGTTNWTFSDVEHVKRVELHHGWDLCLTFDDTTAVF